MAEKKKKGKQSDVTFNLVNEDVIDRLRREGDVTLPKKKVDVPKDMRWNTKQMSSKLLQGILNGDSIDTISDSLMEVIGNNQASAVRNARTMVTNAENAGRLDSYKKLEKMGVVQKKVWIATPDDRTRESHLALDGEEVDIDEPFSNGLMNPGDPKGPPEEVWNCRCSMRTHIIGFLMSDGSISEVNYERDETTHEEQMEEERERRAVEEEPVEKNDKQTSMEDEEEKFQYHATKESSLVGIVEKGIKPSEGHVGKGVYFADSIDDAREWTSETSTGGRTVLRVSEEYLNKEGLEKYSADETGYGIAESLYSKAVPLSEIQIKVGEDEWWSLAQYASQHKRIYDSLSPRAKKEVDKIVDAEWEERLKKWR